MIETFAHVQYRVVKDLRQILSPFVYNWSYDANYARQIFSLSRGNRLETLTWAETDPSFTRFKIYIILIILVNAHIHENTVLKTPQTVTTKNRESPDQ